MGLKRHDKMVTVINANDNLNVEAGVEEGTLDAPLCERIMTLIQRIEQWRLG